MPRSGRTYSVKESGLISYWTFDDLGDHVLDRGVAGNHAKLSSGLVTIVGKVGRAITLSSGVGHLVTVPKNASIDNLTAFTWMAWVNISGVANLNRLLWKDDKDLNIAATGKVYLLVAAATTASETRTSGPITTGVWKHVAATYEDAVNRKGNIFIDGAADSLDLQTAAVGGLSSESDTDLILGNRANGLSPLSGGLDDVRLYNRALTAAEILKIYNDTK